MKTRRHQSNRLEWIVMAVLLLASFGCIKCCHGQQPPPVPSFAQPQLSSNPLQLPPAGQVYMVRAWTPVRNVLGLGPLYRPYIAIGPAQPALVQPVVPVGGR